jgi:hypothetical protein
MPLVSLEEGPEATIPPTPLVIEPTLPEPVEADEAFVVVDVEEGLEIFGERNDGDVEGPGIGEPVNPRPLLLLPLPLLLFPPTLGPEPPLAVPRLFCIPPPAVAPFLPLNLAEGDPGPVLDDLDLVLLPFLPPGDAVPGGVADVLLLLPLPGGVATAVRPVEEDDEGVEDEVIVAPVAALVADDDVVGGVEELEIVDVDVDVGVEVEGRDVLVPDEVGTMESGKFSVFGKYALNRSVVSFTYSWSSSMYSSSSGRGSLVFFVVELEDVVAAVVLDEEEEAVAGTGGGGGSVPVAEVEEEEAEADDVEPPLALDVAALLVLLPVRLSEEAW